VGRFDIRADRRGGVPVRGGCPRWPARQGGLSYGEAVGDVGVSRWAFYALCMWVFAVGVALGHYTDALPWGCAGLAAIWTVVAVVERRKKGTRR
jgi:hypothetical protein